MKRVENQSKLFSKLVDEFWNMEAVGKGNVPAASMLSPALPPDRHIRPRIRQNILIAGMAGLFISVCLVFFLEFVERRKPKNEAVANL